MPKLYKPPNPDFISFDVLRLKSTLTPQIKLRTLVWIRKDINSSQKHTTQIHISFTSLGIDFFLARLFKGILSLIFSPEIDHISYVSSYL